MFTRRTAVPLRIASFSIAALLASAVPLAAADPALIAAAKQEGEVVWYTTQIVSQLVRPVAAAFEKGYGIKAPAARAHAIETAGKVLNEATACRLQGDIFDGTNRVVLLKVRGHV